MQFDESFTLYPSGQAAGCVILDEQGRILLVQQARAPFRGLWHLPMGSIEPGELPEHAAVREALEEAGVQVELLHLLNVYLGHYADGGLVQRYVWLARMLPGQQLSTDPDDEIMDRRFFSMQEFQALYDQGEVRMHHSKLAFQDALKFS